MGYESDTLRFIIICIFFVLWLIVSIIPGGGIIGDIIFRTFVPGVPTINLFKILFNIINPFNWLKNIWYFFTFKWIWDILAFFIDCIPVIGPIINFLIFLKNGYF